LFQQDKFCVQTSKLKPIIVVFTDDYTESFWTLSWK